MKLLPALLAEAIGVFGLTFVGVMAIHAPGNSLLGIALAHGLILAIMITAFAAISGGHINPAVTLGLLSAGKIKPGPAIAYIVAQVLGGVAAGIVVMAIFGNDGAKIVAAGTPSINDPVTHLSMLTPVGAMLAEGVATFFLLIAVWGTAVDPRAPKVGGFAIGLTITADILAIGPLTGGAMNPARATGPAIAALLGGGHYDWSYHWVYWAGPVAGAVLASLIYKGFILPKDEK